MKRLKAALPVLLAIFGTWAITTATTAQSSIPNGVFVKNSDGLIWLVMDGQRVKIPVWPASDEEIAALPVPDRWAVMNDAGAIVAGDRPSWFGGAAPVSPYAPLVGRWARRDAALQVNASGGAGLVWKTGACLSANELRPCDRIVNGAMQWGGQATVVLNAANGDPLKATGSVTDTSQESTFHLGGISITLTAPDLVTIEQDGHSPLTLCRPPREENFCGN